MKKQRGTDYSTLLIWAAALVMVVRYSAAFIASDVGEITGLMSEVITLLMGVSGLGMGILDTIGGAYLFDGWRRKMPKNGIAWSFPFKVLTGFVFLLIFTGVLILIPFTVSRVTHTSVADVLSHGWLNGWALLVNLAPYLLIGGVSIGNQIVNVRMEGEPTGEQTRTDANEGANGSRTFASLSQSDKYFIINNSSALCSKEYGVSSRAIQKWRKRAQDELTK